MNLRQSSVNCQTSAKSFGLTSTQRWISTGILMLTTRIYICRRFITTIKPSAEYLGWLNLQMIYSIILLKPILSLVFLWSQTKHTKFILMNLNYNLMIYRDYKRVRIWDSSNPLAEEYVRACSFSQQVQFANIDSAYSFVNCKDYTHTGYKALSQSTQLLFNDICNGQQLYQIIWH